MRIIQPHLNTFSNFRSLFSVLHPSGLQPGTYGNRATYANVFRNESMLQICALIELRLLILAHLKGLAN
jgi:hypothetical protein